MQYTELEVPVPWGHVAIKAWGDPSCEAVILLHGFIDNAGTFDTLIPLLPKNFYYLCADLPGHGLSSHFPPNLPIHFINFLYALRIITTHFKREKYAFISHSFGGRLSVLFTQLYPELVSKIAVLDVGYLQTNPPTRYVASVVNAFDTLDKTLRFEETRTPSYTYEEAVNKIMNNRFLGLLTYETAEQLMRRMSKKVGDDKYKFTFDQRLRGLIEPFISSGYKVDMFKHFPIKCPAISIYTTNTKAVRKRSRSFFYMPNFKFFEVNGHHHSHHTNPELFAPILTKFLLRQTTKVWGDPKNEAVIAIHGFVDNAGSFDTLIPLLPQTFYYIAIDLPGHGFSSHLPAGLPVFYYNFLFAIQYVAEYFKREKYVLLGHSFGGRLAMLFTRLYPHMVSKIVIMDSPWDRPNADSKNDHLQSLIDSYKMLKKVNSNESVKSPSYSHDEIIKKLMENRMGGSLTIETAGQLARRMIRRVGNDRYEFTYDRRLREVIYPIQSDEYVDSIEKQYPIICPALSIYNLASTKLIKKLSLFRPPRFEWVEVDGHHHSHHTNPELFVPILTKFLLNGTCKL